MTDRRRREFLKTAPLVALTLAGCSSDGRGGGDGTARGSGDGSGKETSESGGGDSTPTADPQTTRRDTSVSVEIGEKVDGDQISMVVKSLEKTDSLGEYQQAKSGNTYAVIRLAVKNTTQDEYANFNSFLQTKLKDSEGYRYDPTLSVSDSAFQSGQLAPGEVAVGDIAFEIPQDASGLTLQFDFSMFTFSEFDRVTVDLSSSAARTADLQQTLHVPVHGVGESVTRDGITVTVNGTSFETSLGEYTEAPEGREFAVVDITTKNGTNEAATFSSLLQMAAKGGDGRSFSYALAATGQLSRGYSGGEVSPGESVRGKLAFEVPAGVSPLYFTFEFSVLTGGSKAFWRLR